MKRANPDQPRLRFEEESSEPQIHLPDVREGKNVHDSGVRREVRETLHTLHPRDEQASNAGSVPSYRQGLIEQIIRDEQTLRNGWTVPECPGEAFFEERIEQYAAELYRLDHEGEGQ